MADLPDYIDPQSRIATMWSKPLSEAALIPNIQYSAQDAERHRIYSLLLMSLVRAWWNGNKNGSRDCDYPWRTSQRRPDGTYLGDKLGDRYVGHNICALAVDAEGDIVDFDFNHNKLFNSSVQHAEARLIRRLFGLAAVQDSWDFSAGPKEYRTDLSQTTVYTSLESCAQCSGIMALGLVPNVFYLQPDPGQYFVAQLMRNLADVPVAQHIPAKCYGFEYFDDLVTAYKAYQVGAAAKHFYIPSNGKSNTDPAMTSFLCTDDAQAIYERALQEFKNFECSFPDYSPQNLKTKQLAKSNRDVLNHAKQFFDYVANASQRGTPHFN
jgi:tRNA(Arg) A34 adenosine deaminase TadA